MVTCLINSRVHQCPVVDLDIDPDQKCSSNRFSSLQVEKFATVSNVAAGEALFFQSFLSKSDQMEVIVALKKRSKVTSSSKVDGDIFEKKNETKSFLRLRLT